MASDVFRYAESIHSRHAAIQKHQTEWRVVLVRPSDLSDGFGAIVCFQHTGSPRGKRLTQDHPVRRVVVHNQCIQALEVHHRSARRALLFCSDGETQFKAENAPCPGSLSTVRLPPISATIRLEM